MISIWFLLLAAMASSASASRIVGGSPTTIDKYPGIASVERYRNTVWTINCASNILTSRWVVSAAHCFDVNPIWNVENRRIRVGSTTREAGGVIHNLKQVIVHPEYAVAATYDADIALLEVEISLTLNRYVATVSIPSQDYEFPDNLPVVHAGWGATSQGGSGSDILRDVTIYTINRELCKERYRNRPNGALVVTDNMICAGILDVGGKDACGGDSGGPLYYGNILVGIISWGDGCASPTYPGVNVKMSSYSNWIVETAV